MFVHVNYLFLCGSVKNMRVKTLALIPAVALLTFMVSLPTAQGETNANAANKSDTTINNRVTHASRSAERLPYASPAYNKVFAKDYMYATYGWQGKQFVCLDKLWTHESGWRVNAHNPSGAHGIPQALPGSKMAKFGSNWRNDPAVQIQWGLHYIKHRYSTPCGAWSTWTNKHWY
ncbi:LT_GEWL domain containing protein [uncultured Caudovirales phage]|uniref:LT_GEWL domain containing protein n=1 Tax=uncultured Caudovirales phage TaxID=2100421 RepID=A0A6J5N4K4_9CAUD|nr:LT_GEWL domain containing protein [uncultured Caudovirales phage]